MSEGQFLSETKRQRLRPYPKYKDSGVEWLGDIPANWEMKPLKALLTRNDSGVWGEGFDDEGVVVLRSTEQTVEGNWNIQDPARRCLSARAAAAARLVCGDLVTTKSSGSQAHIGKTSIVDHEVAAMSCCFSNFMQRLRVAAPHMPRFVWYFMNCPAGREQLIFRSSTTTGLRNLNGAILGSLVISTPLSEEQRDIVAFLDRETAKIDALLAKKERLIELLQEKRTALITQAVTKGLDPSVPMKDSGIEWLGKIPAHWEVSSLKRRAKRIQTGTTPPTEETRYYENGVIPWYGPGSFAEDLPIQKPVKFISESALHDGVARMFEAHSALIVTIGATIGKVAFMEHPGSCNQQITCVTFDIRQVFPKYGAYQLKRLEPVLRGRAPNTTLPIIDQEEVGSLSFVAPLFSEQEAIVVFLERETAMIDALVAKILEAIDRLKEYRTALISAAVTGKIDVRISN